MGTGERSEVTVETFPGRNVATIPFADGMTLRDLTDNLALPGDTEAVIVNGTYVKPDYRLQNGDRVVVIPFMSGG